MTARAGRVEHYASRGGEASQGVDCLNVLVAVGDYRVPEPSGTFRSAVQDLVPARTGQK